MTDTLAPIAVFAIDLLHGYGSERYTVQLVNALAARGVPVTLIVQQKGDGLVHEVAPSVFVLEIGTTCPCRTVLRLVRFLKNSPPRALITTMEKPSLLSLAAGCLTGYKNVVPTLHFNIDTYASLEFALRRKLLRLLVATFYRCAPTIVAVSSGIAQGLQKWVGPRTRIVTVLNGFDLDLLRQRAKAQPSHPWIANKTSPVVISCGRLVPLKGYDMLIKAFARARQQRPCRLVILGEGTQRNDLQSLIASLGLQDDVDLAGYSSNPQAEIAHSDVFVLSSRTEGFGNVLVEAMACGTRIVSTDCPSGPREILDNGHYGQLVPVDDVDAMAGAITQTLATPMAPADCLARQRYLDERFALAAMTDAYLALVESLGA